MVNIEGIIPVTLPQIIPICIAALPLNMFKPSSGFLLTVPRRCFFCGFLLVMFHACLCYAVLSAPCSIYGHMLEKGWSLGSLVCCVSI